LGVARGADAISERSVRVARRAAASATVRVMGPAVSWRAAIGTIPALLTSPTVGLSPTSAFSEAGARMEPSVSVPMAAAQKLAAAPAAGPALEPDGLRLGS
jgi:hypothetical protein